MSQPRISNIRSFADVNYEVDWIHKNLTQLSNLLNQETNETLNFNHLSCSTLTVKGQADDAITNSGGISSKKYISQSQGYRITANGDADFRYLYTDELHAKAFIADLEQALAGGQIISKSVAKISKDFTIPAAGGLSPLFVEEFMGYTGHVFADGDIIRLRQFTRSSNTTVTVADVWGTVAFSRRWANGNPPAIGNTPVQQYAFTRSAAPNAGTGSGTIAKGTLALDYGVTGQGYYEVTAIDGANGANSPYAQCVTWATHPASGCTVKTRFGNLAGITSDTWGALSGYGLYGDNVYLEGDCYVKGAITFTNQGSISISGFNNDAGFITIASAPQSFYGSTEPTVVTNGLKVGDFWFDTNTGVYKMKRCATITPSVTWNNVGVYMDANGVYAGNITAGQITAGTLTGFTIQTNATPTTNGIIIDNTSNGQIRFYDTSNEIVEIGSGVYSGGITPGIVVKNGGVFAIDNGASGSTGIGMSDDDVYIDPPAAGKILLSASVVEISGNTVWHAGNDGSGSLLDADTVDGINPSTVGGNILSLTNPSAITFLRMNANNTVTALSAADFRTALGLGTAALSASTDFAPSTQGAVFGDAGGSIYVSSGTSWTPTAVLLRKIEINSVYHWLISST